MLESAVMQKLMAYADENPDASDTAEGIAKWWIRRPLAEVLPALNALVERSLWERIQREDRVLYRPLKSVLQTKLQ